MKSPKVPKADLTLETVQIHFLKLYAPYDTYTCPPLVCLLADLMEMCEAKGFSFKDSLDEAQNLYCLRD
jgi:hypothetical protein